MVRKVYLTIAALVFGLECWLVAQIGAISIYKIAVGLDWVQILFGMFLGLVIITALALTNSWIVLGEQSPILYWWLKIKQFISKMTWELANQIATWILIVTFIIVLVIGSCVTWTKINQYNNDIRMSGQWHRMYLDKAKDYDSLKRLNDEMSTDYASAVNTIKTHFASGATGHP
jgi:hypothetical protein